MSRTVAQQPKRVQARERAEALEAKAATQGALQEYSLHAEQRIMAEKHAAVLALNEQAGEMDALRRLLKLREHELQVLMKKAGREALSELARGPQAPQLPGHSLEPQ